MSFLEWLFSDQTVNPKVDGAWGLGHILTLVFCILAIVGISFLRKKDFKLRFNVIKYLVIVLLVFELARRGIYVIRGFVYPSIGYFSLHNIIYNFLPRPWCAISVWCMILSIKIKNTRFYNFSCITALMNALVFFAYPGAGFVNVYMQFENIYSIVTHSLLLIIAVSMITLKFTDFKYYEGSLNKSFLMELLFIIIVFAYAFIEIYILKIATDPLYFNPGNDVQKTLGFEYPLFLFVYIIFLIFYYNIFFIIQELIQHTLKDTFNKIFPKKKFSIRLRRKKNHLKY